jgi:hypothetical protein
MDGGELMSEEPAQVPDDLMLIEPGMSPEEVSGRLAAWLAASRERPEPFSATHQRPPLPE